MEQLGVIVEALGQRRESLHIFGETVVCHEPAGSHERVHARNFQRVDRASERVALHANDADPRGVRTLAPVSGRGDALLLAVDGVGDGLSLRLRDEVEKLFHLISPRDP